MAAKLALAAILAAALVAPLFAQEGGTPAPRNEITGRVVVEGGAPIPDGQVSIGEFEGASSYIAIPIEDDGSFRSGPLAPGRYSVSVYASGYVSPEPSPRGERFYKPGDTATLRVAAGGVITGTVTLETGEPAIAVSVTARRVRDENGKTVNDDSARPFETDDRGVYRIYGLDAGTYVVSASRATASWIDPGFGADQASVYHPSSTADTAAPVKVRLGGETSNVDIVFRKVEGRKISGRVLGTTGGQMFGAYVFLQDARTGQTIEWKPARADGNGAGFEFMGIGDGEYLVGASSWENQATTAARAKRVRVQGTDVTGIELRLVALGTLSGRFLFEEAPPTDTCPKPKTRRERETMLVLDRAPSDAKEEPAGARTYRDSSQHGVADASGAFKVKNLVAGAYALGFDLGDGAWYVAAVAKEVPGRKEPANVAGQPIRIAESQTVDGLLVTLRSGAARVRGRVEAPNGIPANLRVHLVPVEQERAGDVLAYFETRVERDGSFEIANMAPGEYRALVRSRPERESGTSRWPLAWDVARRTDLLREARTVGTLVSLAPCQTVEKLALRPPAAQR